jgi:hypothetical protein
MEQITAALSSTLNFLGLMLLTLIGLIVGLLVARKFLLNIFFKKQLERNLNK